MRSHVDSLRQWHIILSVLEEAHLLSNGFDWNKYKLLTEIVDLKCIQLIAWKKQINASKKALHTKVRDRETTRKRI